MKIFNLIFALQIFCIFFALSKEFGSKKNYQKSEEVTLFVNNIGNPNNPADSKDYYQYDFCPPVDQSRSKDSIPAPIFAGKQATKGPFNIRFLETAKNSIICTKKMNPAGIQKFYTAIKDNNMVEFFIDGLRFHALIGFLIRNLEEYAEHTHDETEVWLIKTYVFDIFYNDSNIITADIYPDKGNMIKLDLEAFSKKEIDVTFSYSVRWRSTNITWENRKILHSEIVSGYLKIHWISIVNSVFLVLLLIGFFTLILIHILNKDFLRYKIGTDADAETGFGLDVDEAIESG